MNTYWGKNGLIFKQIILFAVNINTFMKVNSILCVGPLNLSQLSKILKNLPLHIHGTISWSSMDWKSNYDSLDISHLAHGRLLHLVTSKNYIHVLSNFENSGGSHLQNTGHKIYLEI